VTRLRKTALAGVVVLIAVLSFLFAAQPSYSPAPQAQESRHPLDPLTSGEILSTVAVLQESRKLAVDARFAIIQLKEPLKSQVIADRATGRLRRAAFAVLYNWATRVTSEAVVDLNKRELISWKDGQPDEPPMRSVIINRLEEVVKGDPRWQEAVRKRGLNDFSRVSILAQITEGEKLPERNGDRYMRAVSFLKDDFSATPFLVGMNIEVNLTRGTLSQFSDRGSRGQAEPQSGRERPALLPLQILQPNGPDFRMEGSEILWQNWRLHYGVHPRRGLELYDVAYQDGGRWRSVLYRASISEMIAPYGDPQFRWWPQDEGDYGLASYSRSSVVPLNDAPENAVFANATIADYRGNPLEVPRAVAIYERDGGLLWRHGLQARRARELVLTAYTTVDNYDYAFNWIFSQDGSIEVKVQLTGMMNVRNVNDRRDDERDHVGHPMFAHLVAPGVKAPNHQHFFSFRLDFDIDGPEHNSVLELNTERAPPSPENPKGETFSMTESVLKTEQEAKRMLNFATSRKWRIVSIRATNSLGQFSGYALLPGENSFAYPAPDSAPSLKTGFINTHLWVTPYSPDEMHASGDYVNLNLNGQGLPKWTSANRKTEDSDVVVWYTLGVTHIPRTEDWPIMPAHSTGFRVVPAGFFSHNPAMDVHTTGQ
jgi:primary-amine oxidase